MKKLFNVLVLTLAMNFLAVAGGAGYLVFTGRLDRAKVREIREVVMGRPQTPPAGEAPAVALPATRPSTGLEGILERYAALPPNDQVEFIRNTTQTQLAMVDRRQRELADQQRRVEAAAAQVARDRAELEAARKRFAQEQEMAAQAADEKGFAQSLDLYVSMPARSVKTIFLGLDDATVVRYLQAMEPRIAARITREFKSPEETERLKRIMERLRLQQAQAAPR